jgi:serine/threonine-protein kinase
MNRAKFAASILICVIAVIGAASKIAAQRKAGAGTTLVDLSMPAVAISPDGKQIALILRSGDKTQLHIRLVGSQESKPIPGTEGAVTPLFSPDGKWIAFFADGKLKKLAVDTGQIVTLCDAGTGPRGVVWGPDDRIIYTPDTGSALLQVSAAGGTPKPLTERKEERSDRWPEVLPGNKAILFTIAKGGSWDDAQIIAQRFDTGERKLVIDGGTAPHYLSTGHLVYVHGGALTAVAFDPQSLQVTGKPVPLVQGILMEARDGSSQYSISQNGTLVYIPSNVSSTDRRLVWVTRDGSIAETLKAPPRNYEHPRISPDGKRVIVGITGDKPHVFLYDIAANTLKQVTTEANNALPIWTLDGKRFVYRSTQAGPWNVFWKNADGTGNAEQLTKSQFLTEPTSFSPGGKILAFSEQNTVTRRDIWVLPLDGDRKPMPIIKTPADESVPRFSPDGHWIAYVSDESGRAEVYVQPYPTSGQKWQISTSGGREPVWAPNGAELFYREGSTKMMVSEIKTTPSFSAAKARLLFEGDYEGAIASRPNFDISSDGRRFLMLKPVDQEKSTTEVKVMPNWLDEVRRRVATK